MSLADFEAHLNDPAPCFRCYDCGDREEKPTFLARVRHVVHPPADNEANATLDELLGPTGAPLKSFYGLHDGVLMYADSIQQHPRYGDFVAAGIEFFPSREWRDKTAEMRDFLLTTDSSEGVPDWLRQGVVFGEIPHSANYFVIQPGGEDAGKIFYADHDDFNADPIAESFDGFLNLILADPAEFLFRFGCYTRYTDGTTDTQWIPKEYVAG
jgi:hypothetical protein